MTTSTDFHAKWIAPRGLDRHLLTISLEKWDQGAARGDVEIDIFQYDGDEPRDFDESEPVCMFRGRLESDPANPRGARIRDPELKKTSASTLTSSQFAYISFDSSVESAFAIPLNPVAEGLSSVSSLSFRIRPVEASIDAAEGRPNVEGAPPPESVEAKAPVVRPTTEVQLDIETLTQGNKKWSDVILRARKSELPNFRNTGCSAAVTTMVLQYLEDPNPPNEDDKGKSILETRVIPALIDENGAPLDAATTSRPWEFLKKDKTFRPVLGKKVSEQEDTDTEDLKDALLEHAPIAVAWYARMKDGIDEGDYVVKTEDGKVISAFEHLGKTPKQWRAKIVKDNKDRIDFIHSRGYVLLDGKEKLREALGIKKKAVAVDPEGKWATKVKKALDKGLPVWSLFSKGSSRRLYNCHSSTKKRDKKKEDILEAKEKAGTGTDLVAGDFRPSGHYCLITGYKIGKDESIQFELTDTGDSRLVRYLAAMTGDLGAHPALEDGRRDIEKKRTTKGEGAKYLVNGLPVEVRYNRCLKSLAILEPTDWSKDMAKFVAEDDVDFKKAKATDYDDETLDD